MRENSERCAMCYTESFAERFLLEVGSCKLEEKR